LAATSPAVRYLEAYKEIWLVDFEYYAPDGERPVPICLAARELRTNRVIVQWYTEFGKEPPYSVQPNCLLVSYSAAAELSCHIALGWKLPEHVLDLYVAFKMLVNGLKISPPKLPGQKQKGLSLLFAMQFFGIIPQNDIALTAKDASRGLVMRGGPWTLDEQREILAYCLSDADQLAPLLRAMLERINFPVTLFHCQYTRPVAWMQWNGIPVDTETYYLLDRRWDYIQLELIANMDAPYGLYDGTTFKMDRFEQWLIDHEIPWPTLPSGQLELEKKVFRDMAKIYPDVAAIHELRHALTDLRLHELHVSHDGYNRTWLNPFGSKTGRNQPSNSHFIFGPSVWLRGLIKPPQGFGIAYVDWSQQEFGIAAALFNDSKMLEAYLTGCAYLAFAKLVGTIPPEGTKKTHPLEREAAKQCVLATQYEISRYGLAGRIGKMSFVAGQYLAAHRHLFPRYWELSGLLVDRTMLCNRQQTVFQWPRHLPLGLHPTYERGRKVQAINKRSLRNFFMQSNGAEMMRLATRLCVDDGIFLCASVHDALLIMAPLDQFDDHVARTQKHMADASEVVLGGRLRLRTGSTEVKYPARYMDEKRGGKMWHSVMKLINK
jgi:DNA polymerase-1